MFRKKVVFLLLIVFFAGSADAYFMDGRKLVDLGEEVQRADRRDLDADFKKAFMFMGYVQGVADATEYLYCKNSVLSSQQLLKIVLNYLDAHPEKWGEPANKLVINSLLEAFPCK